ncbi:MAG TPA: galactokinase [Spirochaetota bacterium]
MKQRIEDLKKIFCDMYGGDDAALRVFAAPGRVNLIGEHIDYCGGFVFPAALTLDTVVILRKRDDRMIRLAASDIPDRVECSLDSLNKGKNLKWGNYQLGVADELQKAGYHLVGADMLFDGTVPFGSGLSSSASIEVATAIALATIGNESSGMSTTPDLIQMAIISQRAENNYCGVNCGIMDQFASAMGKKGHAILLDCETLEYQYAPLSIAGYRMVLGNTKKKRSLADSKYNERRRETDEGLRILTQFLPGKKNLCSVTIDEFEKFKDEITDDVIRKRVTHVIYENARVLRSFDALKKGDLELFGKLLVEANDSIRDLYEVTGFELDTMTEEAMKIDGTLGARMTGAGFGGCTVNIVRESRVEYFIETVCGNYIKKTGINPEFYICDAGDGAREITEV